MLRRHPVAIVLTTLLLSAGLIGAAGSMQGGSARVAVVNLEKVFDQLKQKTAMETTINNEAQQLEQQAKSRGENIRRLRSDLSVLKPGTKEYRQARSKIQKAAIEFQTWSKFQKKQLQQRKAVGIEGLYHKTLDVIGRIAEAQGYDLVLYQKGEVNFSADGPSGLARRIQGRNVLYARDDMNITRQVIQQMNNQYQARQ